MTIHHRPFTIPLPDREQMLDDFCDCALDDPSSIEWLWDEADVLDWYYDEDDPRPPGGPLPGPSGSVVGIKRESNARHVYLVIYSLSYPGWKKLGGDAGATGNMDRWVTSIELTRVEATAALRLAVSSGVIEAVGALGALAPARK